MTLSSHSIDERLAQLLAHEFSCCHCDPEFDAADEELEREFSELRLQLPQLA